MVFKRLSCSCSEGDAAFIIEKRLSASKLLQERITQIRDEENPALRSMILDVNKKNDNLAKKLGYMSGKFQSLIDATEGKFSKDEWLDIIEKI